MSGIPKGKVGVGRSRRAGVPLARANRLAEKTAGKAAPRGMWLLAATLSGAVAIAIVAFGFLASDNASPTTVTEVTSPAKAAAAVSSVAASKDTDVQPDQAPPAEGTAQARVERPPTVKAEPQIFRAACVTAIEANLLALKEKSQIAASTPWPNKQDEIGTLIQYVLDCPDSSIDMVGSMELIGSGLADLLISWDRFAFTLELRTVPRNALAAVEADDPAARETNYAEDNERRIRFLIR
ncbi:hypothetical protein [Actibacterium sp. 188UL27-1]|uniref:hypothetical protein n=1 Tax=Actibacterium sp. 188UL27-1 TaxID=2786961 RepID=UPI00195739F4|nr:hypothetical protein [Actibacterium sp. 188UL27-1]MBM7069851.1 hypothetical protein [Actibacterium sp. 188UL27-1]